MFFEAIVLGFIQGLTEFLPVSSSGHLWIFEKLVFGNTPSIALEAFLHCSTLLAVIIFFHKKIWSLVRAVFTPKQNAAESALAWKLLTATLATLPIAFLLKPFVENILNLPVIIGTLVLTGILILLSEYFSPQKSQKFSWAIAILLGLVQGIAVIPGISRSGITIVFLLFAGLPRKKAVEISFLLSIPTILGAFIFLLPEIETAAWKLSALLIAGTIAFAAALIAIWGMLRFVEKYWKYFSIWCFAVAGVLLLFL